MLKSYAVIKQIAEPWEIHVEDFLSVSPSMASRTSLQLSQALAFAAFIHSFTVSQWLCARKYWLHCSVMNMTRPLRSVMGAAENLKPCHCLLE